MDILFLSAFPDSYYQIVTSLNPKEVSPAAQKYNHLLLKGLKENGANVTVLCTRDPLSKLENKQLNDSSIIEEDGILYQIAPYHKNRLQNHQRSSAWLRQTMHSYYTTHPNAYLLLDYLAPLAAEAASAAKAYSVIVTDLPQSIYTAGNSLRRSYYIRRGHQIIAQAQSSILLSGLMKEKLTNHSQPSLVIEGIVDSHSTSAPVPKKPYILYAGAISKDCGIDRLVEAFAQLQTSYQLHLYGNGPYVNDLQTFCSTHSNILYGGMIDNATVLQYEQEASLLVNPRPVNTAFSRYSFPSKNLEYMRSGTPLLTTELLSMPASYKPFVYLFPDDTTEGIKAGLEQTLNDLPSHGNAIGQQAQQFVIHEKSEIVQAKKVLSLLKGNPKK